MKRNVYLLISQVYVPDPAAVGQHMHAVARELARRGWRVIVLTSDRGYDDPSVRFPRREIRDGVEIHRLPFSGFGKSSILVRLLGGLSFCLQALVRALLLPPARRALVSTSPPMAPLVSLALKWLRGTPFAFWAMDLNPDQMIAIGAVSPGSLPARLFEGMIRLTLRKADRVVALDRFMGERIIRKVDCRQRLTVLPPWSELDAARAPLDHERNPFRHRHGLDGRFVVMYSGNIAMVHPLDTLLEAALRLDGDAKSPMFVFIGGGKGREAIEAAMREHRPSNMMLLPYQPLETLHESLSAADLHVVAMGDHMVGIVHPCKVYGAMAIGRPILYLGPRRSHIADLVNDGLGWLVEHGQVEETLDAIAAARALGSERRAQMGDRARRMVREKLDAGSLCRRFCDLITAPSPRGEDRP
jgi:glycosyltransferase involved in cell wall biosynthesis